MTTVTDHPRLTGGYGSRRHRLIAALSRLLSGVHYTSRRGLTRGLRRVGGLGWVPTWLTGGATPTLEEQFFRRLELAGETIYDIGAFHGIFTLFFAQRAARVVAFEPSPDSRARLWRNVQANGFTNVTVCDVGVGAVAARVPLNFDPRMAGAATISPELQRSLQQQGRRVENTQIEVVRLDDYIVAQALPVPTFIKLDVEGMELPALEGMRRTLETHHPRLYIEMHGATIDEKRANARRVVSFLSSAGYQLILHVESGSAVAPETAEVAAEGHLYCRP